MKINKLIFKNRLIIFCCILIAAGIFFRFHNLSWGAPYFFHPDERNIAGSVNQLAFPYQMNPKFFAYGTLPIYLIYFLGVLQNIILNFFFNTNFNYNQVVFENAMIIGRMTSAILSVMLLFLIYKTSESISGKKVAFIVAALSSSSIGYIQYSHFLTFEIWLSFFTMLLFYLITLYLKSNKNKYIVFIGITLGILISIKISSLIFLFLSLVIVLFIEIKNLKKLKKVGFLNIERIILKLLIISSIALITVFTTSPYFWLDITNFLESIKYETEVATGILPVFYTQGFINSTPIIYQISRVYPFILNPFVLILLIIILPITTFKAFKDKNYNALLLIIFFLLTFMSQAFLFVKWIRYYIPSLGFAYIITGYFLSTHFLRLGKAKAFLIISILLISLLYAFSYFKTVLLEYSSPISAAIWADKNINENSQFLSEVYDMGIVPFNEHFHSIKLFNFYDLEADAIKENELKNLLNTSHYLIFPSHRILKERLEKPEIFPKGNRFYKNIIIDNLGFRKVYETPCDLFCKILYFNNPIFSYEQTANVFDRPQVLIYKNEKVK